jgi:hypothetical protein
LLELEILATQEPKEQEELRVEQVLLVHREE